MNACSIVAIALTAAASARAGEIPIDVSGQVNEPWSFVGPAQVSGGSNYPTGSQNFGGVPFSIPAGPNNYWNAGAAADFGSGTVSITIPVGIAGVTSAFTLLNTMWGQPGPAAYISVTFNGSAGATYSQPLVGNVNVRDYNVGGYTNTIDNTSTIQVWDNEPTTTDRLDRQEFILPPTFASQVLTSVTITDSGNEDLSRAAFAGLTVSTCQAYVTETITISSSKIVYDKALKLYFQRVTLTNTGATAVNGPLFFILEELPSGVTLVNKSGATSCFAPIGSRFVVALPEGSALAPNTTVVVPLGFSDPSAAAITYTPLVAGSLGGLP
jgi:hypothetical protein